jgi:hypothetical protein
MREGGTGTPRGDLSFLPPSTWSESTLVVLMRSTDSSAPSGPIIRVAREPMRADETFRTLVARFVIDLCTSLSTDIDVHENAPTELAGRSAVRIRFTAGAIEETLVMVAPAGEERLVTTFNLVREAKGTDDARSAFEALLRSVEFEPT